MNYWPTEEDIQLLRKHGWETECESPFEVRHRDGDFATKQAAYYVLLVCQHMLEEPENEQ